MTGFVRCRSSTLSIAADSAEGKSVPVTGQIGAVRLVLGREFRRLVVEDQLILGVLSADDHGEGTDTWFIKSTTKLLSEVDLRIGWSLKLDKSCDSVSKKNGC